MKIYFNAKKYIMAFLIAAEAVIPAVFGSCTSVDKKSEETATQSDTSDIIAETTADERIYPSLPDADYDGYTFNFVQWSIDGWDMMEDIYADASDMTRIGSAVYKRNSQIEDKYNIKIKTTNQAYDAILNTYKQQVMAGDQDFDVFLVRSHEMQFVVTYDVCMELHNLTYCDFSQPWWDRNSIDQLSVGGKLYMAMNDITLRDKNATACVMFNKAVQNDYRLNDIYSLVSGGEWTWDKMIEISKSVSGDTNGDGITNELDTWGMIADDDLVYILFQGSDGRYIEKDENDLPVNAFGKEKTIEIAQKIVDILYNESYFFHLQRLSSDGDNNDMFKGNRALFYLDVLMRVEQLRNMETDFGVLPVPKYDESQKNYGHSVSVHFSSALSVPKTNQDPDRTSVIIEAMAAESKYTVMPEYYNVMLKEKELRDEESKEMLDIIFANRVYDLGEFFQFGAFPSAFLRIRGSGNKDIVSLYKSYESKINAGIDKFIDTLDKFE
jgi:ABC-type sugar transport system, periplasmic component